MAVTGHHARLGTRLLARLYRGRYLKRQSSTRFQGATLIELDVPISGIQLSDWLHRKAHGEEDRPQASSAAGFPLRLSTQQSRTGPVIDGVLRLIANHLDLPIFESTPEVRVLCSAGITQHHCSYDPVRLPPEPPPIATLRPLPSLTTGLPL
jgi:hypothetical protein